MSYFFFSRKLKKSTYYQISTYAQGAAHGIIFIVPKHP